MAKVKNKFLVWLIEAGIIAVFITVFDWAWVRIGNAFDPFKTVADFGFGGVTVGLILGVGFAVMVHNMLQKKMKLTR